MATTKSSSKAKTKTTKARTTSKAASKKTTKVSAKRTSAAATKKPATKAVKATKAPTKTKARLTGQVVLSRLNWLSAGFHLVGAVLVAVLMGGYLQQIFMNFVARDELASTEETVFVPAIHHMYDVELRWVVVGILVAGAIVPLLQLRRSAEYQTALKKRINVWRWIDKAFVSGTILAVVAALSGVQDGMVLKVIGGLIVVTALLGWLSERQNTDPKAKPDFAPFGISLITGMLPWLIILAYAFGTPLWGAIRYPWFVYALFTSVFITSTAYAINQYNYVRRFRNWVNYEAVERNYIIIDIVARVSFAVILVVGLSK